MAVANDLLSELLIAQLLQEDLDLWTFAVEAEKIQLDGILTSSAPDTMDHNMEITCPFVSEPPVDDGDLALAIFAADARLTSDAAYVESLQLSEEASFVASRQYAQTVAAAEKKLLLDTEFARKLQDAENAGTAKSGILEDADSILGPHAIDAIMAPDPNSKGKGKMVLHNIDDQPEQAQSIVEDVPIALPYFSCGICREPFQETFSPISASLSANSSSRLSFGLRLPCPRLHTYCISCLSSYIHHKIEPDGESQDTMAFPIRCPECPVTEWVDGIPDDVAQKILDEKSLLIWYHRKLLDSLPRYYCPNPRCSTLLELHEEPSDPRAVCPYCEVLICVPCRVEWHQNLSCENFQALAPDERSPEDQLVLQLAKAENWRRCPNCSHIVELTMGCNHVTCRCGTHFCFRCGSHWDIKKGRCTRNPSCELWDEEMLLEIRERERERQHAQQPQGQPAPPVIPLQPGPLVPAAVVHGTFEWLDNANIVGNHPFTTRMVQRLNCGYCHARLNSVADLRYHLTHVRRHSVYACCGRLFEDANAYEQHQQAVGLGRHFHRVARP
ncbi:hypothetical protein PILCRDRAFT_828552 [Piloderma croceum F 1598]|uniref:RBR-type E3 ubiquitin transferase n=1 Tax=Piloderma croceum (strain F 1598) TaxID=765440 RepID=A0A0C3F2K9_PILCF|nr:hypothetical protein PILCRDRAFT_828552 [Piloderma croceum F 1598]